MASGRWRKPLLPCVVCKDPAGATVRGRVYRCKGRCRSCDNKGYRGDYKADNRSAAAPAWLTDAELARRCRVELDRRNGKPARDPLPPISREIRDYRRAWRSIRRITAVGAEGLAEIQARAKTSYNRKLDAQRRHRFNRKHAIGGAA